MHIDELTEKVIGAAIAVHKELGAGLLESAYESCLAFELIDRGLKVERQKKLAVNYRGHQVDCAYRLDLVVEGQLIIELKTVEGLLAIHKAQVLSYLKLSGLNVALLMNFHELTLTKGLQRLVLGYEESSRRTPRTLR
ncbi:MAG: GxxExxY protein [Mariprofundaceae bacterium]|nr:GxxExxY protein [Mariprofundaceae bacterium]